MRNLKKVLALVLALVMTMSLVTIANAAEFTDADDISYEEAVDVMTAIGVIEGLDTGAFNPSGTLTREQAAAIICRMMLGDNADKLGTTSTSFTDVAATRWSASYIGYCASLGIVAGNGDGTFNPAGTLTGYAFAKMLLGALGYKADIEGFVGAGWNLKVAAMASKAGLLNDLNGFVGSEPITREEAAQLALNTLKATLVEYTGTTIDVSTGDATVSVGNTQYSYVTSNNSSINRNIEGTTQGNSAQYYTLEFGEQHFPNLKLVDTDTRDDFGNPANQWSLSNVTIGKYSKTPEYVFTAGVSGNTDLDKLKALGLNGFKVVDKDNSDSNLTTTTLTVNGVVSTPFDGSSNNTTVNLNTAANMAALLAYVDNGSLVRVFISDDNADVIEAISVVESQIMQVNRVTDSLVTLKRVENSGKTVNAVDNSNKNFKFLSGLKADDYVVVIPVADGNSYSVADAYLPTTATGAITKVSLNKSGATVGVTVDGTAYEMSNNWTAEGGQDKLSANSVNTTLQSTVYVDQYGYVIYAADVKASTNYFLYDEMYSNVVNNKIHYFAQGWDMSGNPVSLDFGTTQPSLTAGTVYAYKIADSNSNADWAIDASKASTIVTQSTAINANTTSIDSHYFTDSVKFIFTTWDNGQLLSVTTKDGVQKVTAGTSYQYVLNSTGNITAVVVSNDNDVEVSSNILYVEKETGTTTDSSGKLVSVFTAYIDGAKAEGLIADRRVTNNSFYAYAEDNGVYKLSSYTKFDSSATSVVSGLTLNRNDIKNDAYVDNIDVDLSAGTSNKNLNFTNAVVVDLTSGYGYNLGSIKDMAQQVECNSYTISIIYNDSSASSNQGRVAYVYITNINSTPANYSYADTDAKVYFDADCTDQVSSSDTLYVGQTLYVKSNDALESISSVTGGDTLTLVKAPTTATEAPLYSFRVTGNVTTVTAAASADWFSTGSFARAQMGTTGVYGTITASVPYANATYAVTYTITIDGTAGTGAADDTITVSVTNAASLGSNLTAVGTAKNITYGGTTLVLKITADDQETSGTYTVSAAGVSTAAATPNLAHSAA